MGGRGSVIILAFGLFAAICGYSEYAQAQEPNSPTFNQTYEGAFAQARAACKTLWSDRMFDPLRSKIPLGEEKPTFSMLTNTEKLRSKEKPLADSAITTLEKCRTAYAPVYAMLPPQVNAMIHGVEREQDAKVAELYNGKITFGDFNVALNNLNGALSAALSGISTPPKSSTTTQVAEKAAPPPPSQQHATPTVAPSDETRIALVIGNSNYTKLPKLSNPANDARSIADTFQKMGYRTELVLDATENSIRSAVRKFANESENTDVAVVYYAGHAAQLNGTNYLLPADIDIPRTDADIEFSALKVDDLVNSIGSNTKIVFLDACRDNPVLFKNIVKGRGSSPIGLAPASASNFRQNKLGGGVFIAYATDAGAVADDGKGQHSPFTQALLRYMQKPMSIDDMFSLVTREVRLTTKNLQRPFKYASLENIVCLTPACTSMPAPVTGDVVQQARQSADEEFQIALQTNSADALETYLQKYPETTRRAEVQNAIASLKRSEHTEWTLYEVGTPHIPNFIQLSSIQRFGGKAAAKVKHIIDPSAPKEFRGKTLPDAAYVEDLDVYDCTKPITAISEEAIFNNSGELLYHYKWADPQYLNLSIGITLQRGSIGTVAANIACHEAVSTPLVTKEQIAAMKFTSLSSNLAGDGEIFYEQIKDGQETENQKEFILIIKFDSDRSVGAFLPENASIADPPAYRTEVDRALVSCDENKFVTTKSEYWNSSNQLVYFVVAAPGTEGRTAEIKAFSPLATLQTIFCKKTYGGLGIRLASDDGATKVAEVFDGSPAERAGVKKNDIVTHIDGESLGGLTFEQVVEKSRGPADTKVVLTILREGQDNPLVLTVTRENIQMKSVQGGPSK